MITIAEARALPKAQFTPAEESAIAVVMRKVDEEIRESFDGLGAYVTVPADMATARVMAEVCRRVTKPLMPMVSPNGNMSFTPAELFGQPWSISLNFNFAQNRSMLNGQMINTHLISYCLIIAVDAFSENILRVRRDTAQ